MQLTRAPCSIFIATGLLIGLGLAGPLAAQTYTVGTSAAPFGFTDPATKEPAGYSVDVMKAIAEDTGLTFTFTVTPNFGDLPPALLDGRIDILASATTITPQRIEMGMAFSGVYARHTDALYVLGTDDTPYTSINDFSGKAIGANPGNIYMEYLKKLQESGNPFSEIVDVNAATGLPSTAGTAEALRKGIAEAVLAPSFSMPFAQRDGKEADIRLVETYEPVLRSATAIAVREADTDLLGVIQASLSKLMADGTLAELTQRWGINPP